MAPVSTLARFESIPLSHPASECHVMEGIKESGMPGRNYDSTAEDLIAAHKQLIRARTQRM